MAPTRGTPTRPIRIDPALWDRFGEVAGADERSRVLRDFIRWYIGEPGVKVPVRPVDLPAGIGTYVDGRTNDNPAGQRWYEFATTAPLDAAGLQLVDQAGQLLTDTGGQRVFGRSLVALRRAYDALLAAGYGIAGASPAP